jgi:hypothetical protein
MRDLGTDETMVLEMIFKKTGVRVWTGFIWLRIGFSYTHLGTRSRTLVFPKRDRIP